MLSQEYFDAIGFGRKSNSKHSSLNKNNIIRSNELVKDYKLLQKSHSLESIQDFINKKCYELGMINSQSENYLNRIKTITQRALSISKYSVEDAKYYLYTLEGMPDVKGALSNLGKNIQKLFEKFLAIMAGLGKKVQTFVSNIFLNNYVKFYNNFDASKFNNLEAEVKAVKLPSDIVKKIQSMESNLKLVQNAASQIISGSNVKSAVQEDVQKGMEGFDKTKVYQNLFGSDKMPETQKMTVGEFFGGAQKGTKPAMLEILSPNMKKSWDEDLKSLKESTNLIKKAIGETKKKEAEANKGNKDAVANFNKWANGVKFLLVKLQSKISDEFNIKAKIAGMVYHAAKVGCGGKASKEAKKEEK